jgi:hypothetical protein
MDNKIEPSKVYTIANINNARSEKNYTKKEEVENNSQWGKEFTITKSSPYNLNRSTSNI